MLSLTASLLPLHGPNVSAPEDLHLLLSTHRGHEPSARALWNNHAPRLLAFAASILRSRADAEDTVQAVFCRILELPARRIRQVTDPAAWLVQLTRNAALNHLRAAHRERARGVSGARTMDTRPRESSLTIVDQDLDAALAALPRRYREVVILKHVADLTFDQIALSLGLNRNTAASRYRAAMDSLRLRLGSSPESNNADASAPCRKFDDRVPAAIETEVPNV